MIDYAVFAVHVFQKDLAAVWQLLAQRNPEPTIEEVAGTLAAADVVDGQDWSEAELEALYRRCKPVQRAILVRVAEAGTKQHFVTYQNLMEAGATASRDPNFRWASLIANLAWISKHAMKVKGTTKGVMTFKKRGTEGPRQDRYTLEMEKQTADTLMRISLSIK